MSISWFLDVIDVLIQRKEWLTLEPFYHNHYFARKYIDMKLKSQTFYEVLNDELAIIIDSNKLEDLHQYTKLISSNLVVIRFINKISCKIRKCINDEKNFIVENKFVIDIILALADFEKDPDILRHIGSFVLFLINASNGVLPEQLSNILLSKNMFSLHKAIFLSCNGKIKVVDYLNILTDFSYNEYSPETLSYTSRIIQELYTKKNRKKIKQFLRTAIENINPRPLSIYYRQEDALLEMLINTLYKL